MRALVLLLGIPSWLAAQTLPTPGRSPLRPAVPAAGRITPASSSGRAVGYTQFDTLGVAPLGERGDSVTLYLFSDGQHLDRVVPARIVARERMQPPKAWRAQCDAVAHPGWRYHLSPSPSAPYGVIVPGTLPHPAVEAVPPLTRSGTRQRFEAFAQQVWQAYRAIMAPPTDRAEAGLWWDFFGKAGDAGWNGVKLFGVRLPGGRTGAAFTFWMHDDREDPSDNTTGTWIMDGWGLPVAQAIGNLDIYGTVDVDGDGVDEIVTAAGLIQYRNGKWQFPPTYSEEPCLARRMGLGG